MENASIYGETRYKSCVRCSWAGPLTAFEVIPALVSSLEMLRCPNCASVLEPQSGVFKEGVRRLMDGFMIVSGGQTGVDRGALDAAIALGIPHRGWCPKGRKAEDGVIPGRYNMQEMPDRHYWKRTERNVLDSDATLVFPGNGGSKGTALTIRIARKKGRPILVMPLEDTDAEKTVRAWLTAENIRVLNVAGPRESGCPGIGLQCAAFMKKLLTGLMS